MISTYAILLWVLAVVELTTVSWCALWPLRSELPLLLRASGWREVYSFALGNLDVFLLSWAKLLTLLLLITTTPSRRRNSSSSSSSANGRGSSNRSSSSNRRGSGSGGFRGLGLGAGAGGGGGGGGGGEEEGPDTATSNHQAVRRAIAALCGLHSAFLLVKAAAVAVTAPPDLWPVPPQPPLPHDGGPADLSTAAFEPASYFAAAAAAVAAAFGGGGGGGGGGAAAGQSVVGLVYMFTAIVVSLLCSLAERPAACALVSEREDAWEEEEAAAEGAATAAAGADGAAAAAGGASDRAGASGGRGAEGEASLRTPLLAGQAGGGGVGGGGSTAAAAVGAGGAAAREGEGEGEGKGGKGESITEGRTRRSKIRRTTLHELLRLASSESGLVAVALCAGVVAALGQALVPFLTGQLIDFASIEPDRSQFSRTALRLLGVAAVTALFTGTRGGLFTVVGCRLSVRLRKRLFGSLLQQDMGFYDTGKTGEITSRLAADTSTVADQIGLNLNVLMRSATQAAMVLVFMFAACWRLTVVTFILVPVVLTISQVYGAYYGRLSKRVQAALAAANGVAEEALGSMATVKAHAAQDSTAAAYAAKLADYYRLQLTEAALYALYAALTTFLPNLVAAVVLFYGGNLVLAGRMSPGALVSFMLYQQSLSAAFQYLGDVFSAVMGALGAAEKVVELIHRPPAFPAGGPLRPPALCGRVEVAGVSFAYPARPHVRVLQGVSLVAQPGEVVALVGASGGGKSSIVKLLERFYPPAEGRVLLDGYDIADLDPKWYRRQVALVSQEPVLYARSVRRNILLGLEPEDGCSQPPSQAEVEEAAAQANAHDFITALPQGYETCCGERGAALSGGQRQRIAIARALVRRPRVLLLDEATSALDADSEAMVQEALTRVMTGRTVVVIAHRLSTIQGADRIYVVGKGVVQESGTHSELLAAGGVYSQLVRRQITGGPSQASLSQLTSPAQLLRPSASATSLASLGGSGEAGGESG